MSGIVTLDNSKKKVSLHIRANKYVDSLLQHYPRCRSHYFLNFFVKKTSGKKKGQINPNLPEPVNFVPFGPMRYSVFDINFMSLTSHNLYICISVCF